MMALLTGTLVSSKFFASFSDSEKADVYAATAGEKPLWLASYSFANATEAPVECKLYHYDSSNAVEHILWTGIISENSTGPALSEPICLADADVIRAVAGTSVTLHMNFLEAEGREGHQSR